MTQKFLEFDNREDWLSARRNTLGASEIAAAVGLSPFKTALDLWEEKTGRAAPKDLSNNPNVIFGQTAEEHLRGLYMAEHPEYELEYHPYRVYVDEAVPFLTATLDGELIEKETGRRGILEIKTADCSKKAKLQEWKDAIPQYYFCQLVQQQAVTELTGFSFSVLYAKLRFLSGDSALRSYEFERSEMLEDINWIRRKAEEFWHYVATDTMPPLVLG